MMNPDIDTIFLDLGNTLRFVDKDDKYMTDAKNKITEIVGTDEDPSAFHSKLMQRYKDYRVWAFENMAEAPEEDLWTKWLTPEFPSEITAAKSEELTYQFRKSNGRRFVVDGGHEVITELHRRGYKLGIISNLISTREIPEWLEEDSLSQYFSAVVLSSVYGKRKPDPDIYLEAVRQAGSIPERCAYIGDNPERDVTGSRLAGFGMVVLFNSPDISADISYTKETEPDLTITDFREILDIFKESPAHSGGRRI